MDCRSLGLRDNDKLISLNQILISIFLGRLHINCTHMEYKIIFAHGSYSQNPWIDFRKNCQFGSRQKTLKYHSFGNIIEIVLIDLSKHGINNSSRLPNLIL
jgi:hypothetical protein